MYAEIDRSRAGRVVEARIMRCFVLEVTSGALPLKEGWAVFGRSSQRERGRVRAGIRRGYIETRDPTKGGGFHRYIIYARAAGRRFSAARSSSYVRYKPDTEPAAFSSRQKRFRMCVRAREIRQGGRGGASGVVWAMGVVEERPDLSERRIKEKENGGKAACGGTIVRRGTTPELWGCWCRWCLLRTINKEAFEGWWGLLPVPRADGTAAPLPPFLARLCHVQRLLEGDSRKNRESNLKGVVRPRPRAPPGVSAPKLPLATLLVRAGGSSVRMLHPAPRARTLAGEGVF